MIIMLLCYCFLQMRHALAQTLFRSGLDNLYRDSGFSINPEEDLCGDRIHLTHNARTALFNHISTVIEENRYQKIVTILPLFSS